MIELADIGSVVSNPLIVGLVVGAPAALLGFLGYRRSTKLDKVAARAAEVQLVIDAQEAMITSLQADNRDLRAEVRDVRADYRELRSRIDAMHKNINGQLDEMNGHSKHGD